MVFNTAFLGAAAGDLYTSVAVLPVTFQVSIKLPLAPSITPVC